MDTVEIISEPEKSIARINEVIVNAKSSLELHIYIWHDDEIGNEIALNILDAANRGVSVEIYNERILTNDEKNHNLFDRQNLKNNFEVYNPVTYHLNNHPLIKIHFETKHDLSNYMICDKQILLIGNTYFLNQNRECSFLLEFCGNSIYKSFIEKKPFNILGRSVSFYQSSSSDRLLCEMIDSAKKSIYLYTDQIYSNEILSKLDDAILRNVDVTISSRKYESKKIYSHFRRKRFFQRKSEKLAYDSYLHLIKRENYDTNDILFIDEDCFYEFYLSKNKNDKNQKTGILFSRIDPDLKEQMKYNMLTE